MKTATVYILDSCPYSGMTLDLLREHKVRVTTKSVSNSKFKKELVDKTQQMGVPVTEINGKTIIGFDKTKIEEAL